MSRFVNFLDELLHDRLSDIELSMVGRIESFDKENMRADVIPLMKKKSGEVEIEYSTLKDVPVNFLLTGDYYIRPEYKQGDLVHIAFGAHDIRDALNNSKGLASERLFTSENAFITGGVSPTGWSSPGEFSEEGLIIGHREGNAFMKFESDKIVMNFGAASSIEFSATGMKVTTGGVPYDFVPHTHPTGVGPSGPTNPSQ